MSGALGKEAERLAHEVDRLVPDDRRLVELRYRDELTWIEVAAQLGIADRTRGNDGIAGMPGAGGSVAGDKLSLSGGSSADVRRSHASRPKESPSS